MIIDCISDLHGHFPKLKGGDLLICAGDCTSRDRVADWVEFFDWMKVQCYRQKIVVAGNHDGFLERCISSKEYRDMMEEVSDPIENCCFEYLCDSGIEFDGLKIWGSPWTPKFYDWHFMLDRGDRIRQKWALIPDDVDILVTHGPPFGMLDKTYDDRRPGCKDLADRILHLKKLKLHVFGHIHEGYGQCHAGYEMRVMKGDGGYGEFIKDDANFNPIGHLSVNCAIMDENYNPVNKPIRIEL